jgi:hypothetical protein
MLDGRKKWVRTWDTTLNSSLPFVRVTLMVKDREKTVGFSTIAVPGSEVEKRTGLCPCHNPDHHRPARGVVRQFAVRFCRHFARANFVAAQQAASGGSGVNGGIKLQLTWPVSSVRCSPLGQAAEIDGEPYLSVTMEDESSKLNFDQIFGSTGKPFPETEIAAAAPKTGAFPDLLDATTDWVDGDPFRGRIYAYAATSLY